jgi:hypothetical protein
MTSPSLQVLVVKLTLLFSALTCCLVGAAAFQSSQPLWSHPNRRTRLIPSSAFASSSSWKHSNNNNNNNNASPPFHIIHAPTILAAKKDDNENNQGETSSISFWNVIQKTKPGTLIAAPFVILVGWDLVANIFFLAKRTFEYLVFGKLPSTEVWFSDNFLFLL